MPPSSNANLASLAGELIDHIASYCCQQGLVSLCRAGHRYKESAQPALFREVLFTLNPLKQPQGWHAASRIHDLVAFHLALCSNLTLRKHIVAVHLSWNGPRPHVLQSGRGSSQWPVEEPRRAAGTMRDIIELLLPLSTLRRIHIGTFDDCSSFAALYSRTNVASASLSLAIRVDVESNLLQEPDFVGILHSFKLRNLHTLKLKSMRRLDCEVPPSLRCGTHFSDVQHLIITKCGLPYKSLVGVLSWPKRLRSIRVEIRKSACDEYPGSPRNWSIGGFCEALEPQRLNLESIHLDMWDSYDLSERNETPGQAFRWFSSLRVLEIPLLALFQFSWLSGYGGVLNPPIGLMIHEMLPRNLEKLILFFDEYDVLMIPDGDSFPEIVEWLSSILSHVDIFSSLRLVRLEAFKQMYPRLRAMMRGFQDFQLLVDDFKRHGITLEYP